MAVYASANCVTIGWCNGFYSAIKRFFAPNNAYFLLRILWYLYILVCAEPDANWPLIYVILQDHCTRMCKQMVFIPSILRHTAKLFGYLIPFNLPHHARLRIWLVAWTSLWWDYITGRTTLPLWLPWYWVICRYQTFKLYTSTVKSCETPPRYSVIHGAAKYTGKILRFVRWIFPLQSQFSLICTWTNGRANNRYTGDLRRHRTHCDVTVMISQKLWLRDLAKYGDT